MRLPVDAWTREAEQADQALPYAESATGNLATEDLVGTLDGLGIAHGVDLPALVELSTWMADQLGRPSPSRVVKALSGS